MISNFPEYLYKLFTAPVRIGIYPMVSLYEGETKLKDFRWNDKIINFTIYYNFINITSILYS
jgi:hypothetical protein